VAQRTPSVTLVALLTLVLLAGCTLSRPLAYHAVSYNRAVESAQNRMLFLNIVRASHRRPMYFTAIGSITASLSYEVSSGKLSVTKLRGTTTTESDSDTDALELPSVSYSNKPTVEVKVLDTQEFMKGTLDPVEPDVFTYYLNQGWRLDLLAYLLIERMEFDKNDSEPHLKECRSPDQPLENDPKPYEPDKSDKSDKFSEFRECIDSLMDQHCTFTSEEAAPLGTISAEPTYQDLIKANESKLIVRKAADGFELLSQEHAIKLRCGDKHFEVATGRSNDAKISMTLRSPQGVLYYLGEVMRTWEKEKPKKDHLPFIRVDDGAFYCPPKKEGTKECVPLFMAGSNKDKDCPGEQLSVEYDGHTYRIPAEVAKSSENPGCHPGRSMQALTLASQLIALQKSGKELPGTSLVRIVGQ
jgi:hypothetical protein